ncbi:hypothetical protein [Myxosarcina sp. GI1]|nr:hypothetical protein [Myxosarcina sp. GI1]
MSQLQRECSDKLQQIYSIEQRSPNYVNTKEQIPAALQYGSK